MCIGPKAPKMAPPPPPPPVMSDASMQGAYSGEKRRQRAMAGRGSTILTGGSGIMGAAPTGKTVLGG